MEQIAAAVLRHILGFGTVLFVGTSNITFRRGIARHSRAFHPMLAFEAVAGETSQRLRRAMPVGSKVIVYGALSEQGMSVSP